MISTFTNQETDVQRETESSAYYAKNMPQVNKQSTTATSTYEQSTTYDTLINQTNRLQLNDTNLTTMNSEYDREIESDQKHSNSSTIFNANSIPLDAASDAKSLALKFLVSALYCGSVIGKAGSNIRMFQAESNTQIKVSQNNSYFPGTNRDRIVLVQGKIFNMMKGISLIVRCISDEHEGYTSNGLLTFRLIIPELACGLIIGRNGTTVKEIHTKSGARISLNDRQFQDLHERVLTMSGTIDEILHATSLVLHKFAEDEKCGTYRYVSTNYNRCYYNNNNNRINNSNSQPLRLAKHGLVFSDNIDAACVNTST